MQLTARKREILRRVIEEYVATGQPVGSRALVERSGLNVSPSTVRGELAELEALGLRLDEPMAVGDVTDALDHDALGRLVELGLVELARNGRGGELRLTRRGRFLGGGVTSELLVEAAD